MREVAEEERRLAIAKSSYHQGIPAITVIVDVWSRHIIGGMEAKQLLVFAINTVAYVLELKQKKMSQHNTIVTKIERVQRPQWNLT